VKYSICEI